MVNNNFLTSTHSICGHVAPIYILSLHYTQSSSAHSGGTHTVTSVLQQRLTHSLLLSWLQYWLINLFWGIFPRAGNMQALNRSKWKYSNNKAKGERRRKQHIIDEGQKRVHRTHQPWHISKASKNEAKVSRNKWDVIILNIWNEWDVISWNRIRCPISVYIYYG